MEAKADSRTENHPTTHYIWRTQSDGKVRQSHAANDGKIFSWDEPPETGHPGEDYGCRCIAEPYYTEVDEFFKIDLQNVSDSGRSWRSLDFVNHYFYGNGRTVTVRETGPLADIIAQYHSIVIDNPKRLPGQIADEARKNVNQSFSDTFGKPYQMQGVVFSIGNTIIKGNFNCYCKEISGILEITGKVDFELTDLFRDPVDLEKLQKILKKAIDEYIIEAINRGIDRVEEILSYVTGKIGELDQSLRDYIYDRALRALQLRSSKMSPGIASHFARKAYPELPGGTPYKIVDQWSASVTAKVYLDGERSQFKE